MTNTEAKQTNDPEGNNPDAWVAEHSDALFRFAMRQVQRQEVAEDLVQETFVAALKSRHTFRGDSTERTWLVSILKHKLLDHVRKQRQEMKSASDSAGDDWIDALFTDKGRWKHPPAKWDQRPDEVLQQAEFLQVFATCQSHLPKHLGTVFQLREMEQNSAEEICKQLRITETNLWVMLHRARLRLWNCLSKHWFEQEKNG